MRSIPKVKKLEVRESYVLDITFEDGEHRIIDMSKRLNGKMFEPLRDPAFFRQASIDPVWHTVVWPNGADIAPEFLYEGLPAQSRKKKVG